MAKKRYSAKVGNRDVSCLICGTQSFFQREIKLNTSGLELLDLGWANASATGLICTECGYVHEFFGDTLEYQRI